jgi:hypothetical protein
MIDNFPTLDQLRLPDQQFFKHVQATPMERKISSKPPKVQGEFLKGPIPLAWLGRAAKLPGKASLATAIAIMFEVGRRRSQEVVLTTAILKRFGVNRKAKYRALKLLEKAGLISVVRRPRKNPLVAVLVVEDGTTVYSQKPIVSADAVPTDYLQSLIQNEGSIQCSI